MSHNQVIIGKSEDVAAEYGVQNDGGPFTVLVIRDGKIVSVDEWNDLERAKVNYEWGAPDTCDNTFAYQQV
jgi:ABC-type sulfate transport system substrate-binding protein